MKKYEVIDGLLEQNNGYLFTKDVENADISRTHLANYVRERGLYKVSKGIYISSDTWEDELYVLQLRYPKIVFSGETALYLHGLIDREYSDINVTVPVGFNRTRLCEEGIVVHQEKNYSFGIEEIKTNFGNLVRVYDKERCICEIVKRRKEIEIQHFQTAMKTYARSKEKDINRLMTYAYELKISDEIRKYMEMLL